MSALSAARQQPHEGAGGGMWRWLSAGGIVAVLAVAFVLRAGAAWVWQARRPPEAPFAFGDSASYWHLAERIARGEPYAYPDKRARVFRTPLYPMVLAPLFWLWRGDPPVLAARMLGALLGTWAVWEVWRLARELGGERSGWWAALLAAIYPGAVAMSVFVLAEALFCPLMVVHLRWWVRSHRRASAGEAYGGTAAGAGIGAALATLARPSWLLFVPFGLVVSCADRRLRGARRWRWAGLTVLGFVVAMAPWWYRNYRVTGHVVLTTLQVGASLYDSWHEGATGASDMAFTRPFERAFASQWDSKRDGDYEVALDRAYRRAAWEWAREHPGRVFQLAGVKFWRMWRPWPSAAIFSGGAIRLGVAAGFLPVLVLGAVGWWRCRGQGWPIWLLACPAVYFTILHVVFVSSIRYRQPAMLVWCVPAGWALAVIVRRWRTAGA